MNKIKKQPLKVLQVFLALFFLLAVFLSCGIDEYYYLPQVPEGNIIRHNNTEASIILPPIDYYYATNYSIFYRIYISAHQAAGEIKTSSERSNISPALARDFDAFFSITDPASTSLPSSNTFTNRNYFELEFEGEEINNILSISGRTLNIKFPTGTKYYPFVTLGDGREFYLRRSGNLISPVPDRFFRNTSELSKYENAVQNINEDVEGRSNVSDYAYVSMYIVAVGYNNTQFNYIYSKPTHISIFRLPDAQ